MPQSVIGRHEMMAGKRVLELSDNFQVQYEGSRQVWDRQSGERIPGCMKDWELNAREG